MARTPKVGGAGTMFRDEGAQHLDEHYVGKMLSHKRRAHVPLLQLAVERRQRLPQNVAGRCSSPRQRKAPCRPEALRPTLSQQQVLTVFFQTTVRAACLVKFKKSTGRCR